MVYLRLILLLAMMALTACATQNSAPQSAEFDNTLWQSKTALATQLTQDHLKKSAASTLCGQKKYLSCLGLKEDPQSCASQVDKYVDECLERARNRVDMLNAETAKEHTRYFYYCVMTEQAFDRKPAESQKATKCLGEWNVEIPYADGGKKRRR